jgi:ribonuclease HI
MIKIFTDGGTCGPNGKLGTVKEVGIGVYCPEYNTKISKCMKGISNNEAEFKALIEAMKWAIKWEIKEAKFLLDSKIVVNRADGKRPYGKWKNERMDKFQDEVLKLSKCFTKVKFLWIPREKNWMADSLSKQATR